MILLQDTTQSGLLTMAERLVQACDVPVEVGQKEVAVTISVGAATLSHSEQTGPELLEAADQALYRAKAKGRNCASL